jgi:hypothetical protein
MVYSNHNYLMRSDILEPNFLYSEFKLLSDLWTSQTAFSWHSDSVISYFWKVSSRFANTSNKLRAYNMALFALSNIWSSEDLFFLPEAAPPIDGPITEAPNYWFIDKKLIFQINFSLYNERVWRKTHSNETQNRNTQKRQHRNISNNIEHIKYLSTEAIAIGPKR